jgi:hypothetical protein
MAHPENGQKIVTLKVDRPRFDGGIEIDLNKYFEAKRRATAILPHAVSAAPEAAEAILDHGLSAPNAPVDEAEEQAPISNYSRIMHILLQGPLEIVVGLAGVLTTILALMTFSACRNQVLVAQSKVLFQDCGRMFVQGWANTLLGPGKAVRELVFQ